MSIFLLTYQVSLVERIGLHLNRFYTSQFHAKLGEFINLVRVVGQKNEVRIYLKDAQNIFDISVLSVIMLHAQHFISFKSVNVLKLLKILNVHTGSAFSYISASSAFLNEVKEDSIASAYFLDCSIKLLPTVTIKTSHQFGGDTTAVESSVNQFRMNVTMGKDDDVTFVDEVLKGIGGHFTENGFERSLADIDGCAVDLMKVQFGWDFTFCLVEWSFGIDEGFAEH